MANKQEITPVIGIKRLYVSKLISEVNGKYEYDAPKYFPLVKQIQIKVKESSDPFYAESRKIFTMSTLQDIAVSIDIADLTDEDECYLMGHKLAETGGIIKSDLDRAPTVAIMFEAEKSNGERRYETFYAGNFGISDEDIKGMEGKANYQSKKLQASFRPLDNGTWSYKVDSDSPNVTKEFLSKFFDKVIVAEAKKDLEKSVA
ncbi:major tail protein [Eubacterium multiforme]|uniref:Phi13 family phage major tail protein n=1 Tax=Eubacterium multiforme TaxID=83339 RepID=A0ABT9USD7_9FIRM|nr:major tail protein [Eubacterium multiforme]MDQ0149214.1 phi13 family phage major tail protein [Eubacterium multiforme]